MNITYHPTYEVDRNGNTIAEWCEVVERAPDAVDTFRWARVNNRKKRHLWLGGGTACGITKWHTIDTNAPKEACKECMAYARGWLDRHTLGANPPLDISPLGADTRLPKAADQ